MADDILFTANLDNSKVIKALDEQEKAFDDLARSAEKDFDKIQKETEQTGKRFEKLGKAGRKATGVIKDSAAKATIALVALGAGIQKAFEIAQEAVAGLRIERSFFQLSAAANQSGEDILNAMREASLGVVDDITLMTKANQALQLGVARTPAEFRKLTASAIALGQSVGRGPVESLDDLINAAGRRSTEVLDNLGISLSEVNAEMERLAQQEFGQPVTQLDQAQRNALFMAAALEVAARQAETLGGNLEDIGTPLEQQAAQAKNLKQELGEVGIIALDLADNGFRGLFKGESLFERLINGAKAWQVILIQIIAILSGLQAGFKQFLENVAKPFEGFVGNLQNLVKGNFNEVKLFDVTRLTGLGENIGDAVSDGLNTKLDELNKRFGQIIDPEAAAAATAGVKQVTNEMAEELSALGDEAEKAQQKINDALAKNAIDLQRRLIKIQIDGERDRINDLIKNAQKREDIARKNAQKIEDIFRENQQDITDAATDLSREEQDIARRAARDRGEVERDLANERVDIEREFRQELLRIQQQFNQSAEEAERNNDAQAFLQAVRTRDDQVDQAKLRREGSIDEAKIEGERRRDELKKSLAFEIEDAKIANRRKLEDLQISLQRELDAQQINLDRQLEAQALAEARQAQERQLALQRQLEDFARANRLKREDLQRSLEAEFAAVRAFETAKANFAIAETRRAVDTIRRLRAQLFGGRSGGGSGSSAAIGLPTTSPFRTRQEGGPVNPNQPFLVGEAGPELFVPAQAGNIIPNNVLFSPPVQSAAIQQMSQSNTTNSPTFNLNDTMFNDPVARQNLRNFILETMGGV